MKHEEICLYFKQFQVKYIFNLISQCKFTVLYTVKMKVIISYYFGKNKVITIYIMSGLRAEHRKQ